MPFAFAMSMPCHDDAFAADAAADAAATPFFITLCCCFSPLRCQAIFSIYAYHAAAAFHYATLLRHTPRFRYSLMLFFAIFDTSC